MKQRTVGFDREALDDLDNIEGWIAEERDPMVARVYVQRIIAFCRGLEFASERGTRRPELGEGVRSLGFEHRITIVFEVGPLHVSILAVHYGGRDWLPNE